MITTTHVVAAVSGVRLSIKMFQQLATKSVVVGGGV